MPIRNGAWTFMRYWFCMGIWQRVGRIVKRRAMQLRAIVIRPARLRPSRRGTEPDPTNRPAELRDGSSRVDGQRPPKRALSYWERRKDLVYLHVVRTLMDSLSVSASSAIDIGSNGCPYVTWLPDHISKASLDLRRPYIGNGVESIKADFIEWQAPHRYDLVTCLQVLEHVPNVKQFCEKLLQISNVLIVSVPYKWPKGKTKNHVHDPVDEKKMLQWFGFEPNFSYVATEVLSSSHRLIHVYDAEVSRKWASLKKRERLLQA